jgi:hypothetical protein
MHVINGSKLRPFWNSALKLGHWESHDEARWLMCDRKMQDEIHRNLGESKDCHSIVESLY